MGGGWRDVASPAETAPTINVLSLKQQTTMMLYEQQQNKLVASSFPLSLLSDHARRY
jgi:hypothetical protein